MFHQLTDKVYYMDCEPETDRPVLGYIVGEKKSMMIDAGNSKHHVFKFFGELYAKGLTYPDYVILTHSHWDHTFGLHAISAETISSEATKQALSYFRSVKWTREKLDRYVEDNIIPEFCKEHILLEYPELSQIRVTEPAYTYYKELSIDLGGVKCILKHVPNPHTADATIIYVPEQRVVFLGDACSEEVVGVEWIEHKDRLRMFADIIESMDVDWCVISHDAPVSKTELLNEFRERLEAQD